VRFVDFIDLLRATITQEPLIPCSLADAPSCGLKLGLSFVCTSFDPWLCPSDNFPDANPDPTYPDRRSDGPEDYRPTFSPTFSRRGYVKIMITREFLRSGIYRHTRGCRQSINIFTEPKIL
jgi:hypothetical protein